MPLRAGASHPHERDFLLRWGLPLRAAAGLTPPPQADAESPSARMFLTGVDIPVMPDTTLWADPFTHIKGKVFHDMLAFMAGFTGGIPTIDLGEGSSVPLGFVFQLADKLTPSDITNGLGQAVVFDHVLDRQTLHADHLVFANDACAEFVLVVSPSVLDTSVNTGDFEAGFLPVLGTFLLLGMPSLGFCQSLFILGIELGIANSLTSGEDDHRFETQDQDQPCD